MIAGTVQVSSDQAPLVDRQFESRKADHIRLSLDESNQSLGLSGFDQIQLIHNAFPEMDLADVSLSTRSLGLDLPTPFLLSSMTAGHAEGVDLNRRFAKGAAQRGWLMGVGSQRKELFDPEAAKEWADVRKSAPNVRLLGNIGLSQLIQIDLDGVKALVDSLEAVGMIVHLNPLQEALQPEGTPQFRNGLHKLEQISKALSIPVIVKETGCGLSEDSLVALKNTGVTAVDVSGLGGTHWGRIEGGRSVEGSRHRRAANVFRNWGIPTVVSLSVARDLDLDYEVWGSGGVRSGLDAAKALALGARIVGVAQPMLKAALESEEALVTVMEDFEFELKVAMFCTGSKSVTELANVKVGL